MNLENLGTLRAAIEGDTKELSAGIDDAKKKFKGFGSDMPKWVKPVGTAMLAAGGIVTGAITKMIFDAGAYGDSLDKMSLRTGVTVEWLSKLGYAAKISGTDMTALETSFRFLARRMDETREGIGVAKDQFDKLGISVTDATGEMRPSVDVMMEVADGLTGLKSESEKVALAMDIFGARSGPQLLPLLKQGSDGIKELTRAAEDMGLVVSIEAAAAAAEFEDRLTDLKETAKKAGFEFAQTLMPAVTGTMEKVTGLVGWFNRMSDTEKKIVGWGTAVSGGLAMITGASMLLLTKLPLMMAGLSTLVALPAAIPIAIGLAAVAAAAVLVTYEVKHMNKEMKNLTAWKMNKEAAEGSGEAMTTLMEKLGGAKKELGELTFQLGQAKDPVDTLAAVTKALGEDILVSDDAYKRIVSTIGDADGYISVTQAAKKATEELNKVTTIENVKGLNKAYEDITKEFKEYTSIVGEGYRANSLELVAYWEKVLAEGVKGEKEERLIANKITDLKNKMWSGNKTLLEAGTRTMGAEVAKREVIDDDYLTKIQRNSQMRLQDTSEKLQKESGLIERFFNWGFVITQEAAAKVKALEKQKVNDMIAENERYFDMMIQGTERMIQVKERVAKKDYDLLVRGNQAGLAADREANAERGKLADQYLRNTERRYEASFDIQTAFKDKTASQLQDSYAKGISLIESEYQFFKAQFEKINLDMVDLDQWRADKMLEIEKKLAAAKKKEVEAVFQTYEEHVMETSRFWMVEEGFKIPLGREREKSFSELAMFYGLSEAMGMREEEESRIPTMVPSPPVAQEEAYTAIRAPYRPTAAQAAVGGPTEIHIHIENLYGGDEATMNDLAEDVARRIKGNNIQI